MPTDSMNPATAVTWGPFIPAAYNQFATDPGQSNPAAIKNMPAGYKLVRTIQMSDFFGSDQSRVFYGFVAVGGDPETAVVALRGTATVVEWWDDLHWGLVPFAQVSNGGKVAQGFLDIYSTFGTTTPGQQQGPRASGTFATDVAQAVAEGLAADLDPALPTGGVRPQSGWRAGDTTGRGHDREHATEAPGVDIRLTTGGRCDLRRTLRWSQRCLLADLQPS